eukprot:600803-Amphidinium_carterae.1
MAAGCFTLQQLCHRNADGLCALTYAEEFAAVAEDPIWHRVRDTIQTRIISSCEGCPLPELILEARGMRIALTHVLMLGENGNYPSALDKYPFMESTCQSMWGCVLLKADALREQWRRQGWRFHSAVRKSQIQEVINHFS